MRPEGCTEVGAEEAPAHRDHAIENVEGMDLLHRQLLAAHAVAPYGYRHARLAPQ
jgi:hypothetical protein